MSTSVSNPYTFNIQSNTSFDTKSAIPPILETTKLTITVGTWSTEHADFYGFSGGLGVGGMNPRDIIYNGVAYKIIYLYDEDYQATYFGFDNWARPFSSITLECKGRTCKLDWSSWQRTYGGDWLLPKNRGTYTINIVSVTV